MPSERRPRLRRNPIRIGGAQVLPVHPRQFGRVEHRCTVAHVGQIEREILPWARAHEVGLVVYSPIGQGLLTGKVDATRTFPADDGRAKRPTFTPANRARVNATLERVVAPIELTGLAGWASTLVCLLPVLLGFLLPAGYLAHQTVLRGLLVGFDPELFRHTLTTITPSATATAIPAFSSPPMPAKN